MVLETIAFGLFALVTVGCSLGVVLVILVYVGGVLILVTFAVMLTRTQPEAGAA